MGNDTSNKYYLTAHIMLMANIIAFVLGVIYLIWGSDNMVANIYGIYIMIVLLLNIVQGFLDLKYNYYSYLYLALSMLFMFAIPLFNTLFSFSPAHQYSRNIFSSIAFLSLFVLGGLINFLDLFKKKSGVELMLLQIADKHENESLKTKIIRVACCIILVIILLIGVFISCSLIFNIKLWRLEAFISAFALFYAFMFLSAGTLLIKMIQKNIPLIKILCLIITLCIFVVCILPLASVPSLIKKADISYFGAFSDDYKDLIDFKNKEFRQVKFSIPEYFFGTVSKDYIVRKDIPFYNDSKVKDNKTELYFDAYHSSRDGDALPGGNSVLIRIHGGEWKYGDKGFWNNAQINKYFASQGYVVFDIQYGLNRENSNIQIRKSDEHRYGEYTIDDMVGHIGKFTKYLAKNHEEFNANIESVFISGGSAGGNLALSTGLALASGEYNNILAPAIKIKGIIPFYPANALANDMGLYASDAFLTPGLLVDEFSPPCIVFQGKNDGLVSSITTEQLQEEYKNHNNECSIIYMPYGGHACDAYFSGYYNQTFLYYMERFMYQYR